MQLKLYKNYSENRQVEKNIADEIVLNGTLRNANVSIVDPAILIEQDATIFTYNYAYIPEFKRYYYIQNITSVRNNLLMLDMHCDVLMSFKDEFLGNDGYIDNSQLYANMYLHDGRLPVQQNTEITYQKQFASGFSGASIIMNGLNITRANMPHE